MAKPWSLEPNTIRAIRREQARGVRQVDLARKYHISPSLVSQICLRLVHSDVSDEDPEGDAE